MKKYRDMKRPIIHRYLISLYVRSLSVISVPIIPGFRKSRKGDGLQRTEHFQQDPAVSLHPALFPESLSAPEGKARSIFQVTAQTDGGEPRLLSRVPDGLDNFSSQAFSVEGLVQFQKPQIKGFSVWIPHYQIQTGGKGFLPEQAQKQLMGKGAAWGQAEKIFPALFQGGRSVQGNGVVKAVSLIEGEKLGKIFLPQGTEAGKGLGQQVQHGGCFRRVVHGIPLEKAAGIPQKGGDAPGCYR